MTPINWRRAVPADAPALSLLGGATFLTSFANDHPGQALVDHARVAHGVDYYAAALADPEQTIIIGETPLKAVVAYAMVCPPALPIETGAGDIELKRIYLLAPWQGSGNGAALMAQVIALAIERGASRLLLAVYPQNEGARRFYERHAFGQIGRMTFMVGDTPFEDLIYARPLSGQ